MKIKNVKRIILSGAFIAPMLFSVSTSAAPMMVVQGAKLMGATDVEVSGKKYDVYFVDGTCASVFGNCSSSSFLFKTLDDAKLASQALLDQVFVNFGGLFQFDTSPNRTNGCTNTQLCVVYTPYAASNTDTPTYSVATAENAAPSHSPDGVSYSTTRPQSWDLTEHDYRVFARWNLAATEVPEPGSLALVALALAGLGLSQRRKSDAV